MAWKRLSWKQARPLFVDWKSKELLSADMALVEPQGAFDAIIRSVSEDCVKLLLSRPGEPGKEISVRISDADFMFCDGSDISEFFLVAFLRDGTFFSLGKKQSG